MLRGASMAPVFITFLNSPSSYGAPESGCCLQFIKGGPAGGGAGSRRATFGCRIESHRRVASIATRARFSSRMGHPSLDTSPPDMHLCGLLVRPPLRVDGRRRARLTACSASVENLGVTCGHDSVARRSPSRRVQCPAPSRQPAAESGPSLPPVAATDKRWRWKSQPFT